ncbi:MAG: hypothetical protein EON59_05540 [Alphaproteobacteria bacterium]|nr:MAG: hypothetical protein EON59_05540 [Alphaproteobacteria bacterium]
MTNILIVYASPSDEQRIRVDLEQKRVARSLAPLLAPKDNLVQIQASTPTEFAEALSAQQFDIVQFSAHGSLQSLVFETEAGLPEPLNIDRIISIIDHSQRNVGAVILMACHSVHSVAAFHEVAEHVICIDGAGDDDACIKFIELFYRVLSREHNIGRAYNIAYQIVYDDIEIVYSKRAKDANTLHIVIPPGPFADCPSDLYIDMSSVLHSAEKKYGSTDQFIKMLRAKFRYHRKIFTTPRSVALIPIGRHVATFSWETPEHIKCHDIRTPKAEADKALLTFWLDLVFDYDLGARAAYRRISEPSDPINTTNLRRAKARLEDILSKTFNDEKAEACIPKELYNSYIISKHGLKRYINEANVQISGDETGDAVSSLELALSCIHDLIDALSYSVLEDESTDSQRLTLSH